MESRSGGSRTTGGSNHAPETCLAYAEINTGRLVSSLEMEETSSSVWQATILSSPYY